MGAPWRRLAGLVALGAAGCLAPGEGAGLRTPLAFGDNASGEPRATAGAQAQVEEPSTQSPGERAPAALEPAEALPAAPEPTRSPWLDELHAEAADLLRAAAAAEKAGDRIAALEPTLAAIERLTSTEATLEDPEFLAMLSDLGSMASRMGSYEASLRAREWVVRGRELSLAPEDPALLKARGAVAATFRHLDDSATARRLLEEALAVAEAHHPPDHPVTLLLVETLASARSDLGDYEGSLALQERVLVAKEGQLPASSHSLLGARLNYATGLNTRGRLREGRALIERAIADYEPHVLPDDLRLLHARYLLAQTIMNLGDSAAAAEQLAGVLESLDRTLPRTHALHNAVRATLAAALFNLGRGSEALGFLQDQLDALQEVLTPDDPRVLSVRFSLGSAHLQSGLFEQATQEFLELYDLFARTRPPGDLGTLTAGTNLALALKERSRFEEARGVELELLEVYRRHFPPHMPELLKLEESLAGTLRELGELSGARILYERVLRIREERLPEYHPELQTARSRLAEVLRQSGDLMGALSLMEQALAVMEATLPPENRSLQEVRGNLAALLDSSRETEAAIHLYKQTLAAYEAAGIDPADPQVLGARASLAAALARTGEPERALEILEEVHAIRERRLRPDNRRLLTTKSSLYYALTSLGRLEEGLARAEEALAGYLRRQESDTASVRIAWGQVCSALYLLDRREELARAVRSYAESMQAGLRATLSMSPREARERCAGLFGDISFLLFLAQHLEGEFPSLAFEVSELHRAVGSAALLSPTTYEAASPEHEALKQRSRALRSEIQELTLRAAAGEPGARYQAARASFERDSVEAELRGAMVEDGWSLPTLTVEALAEALPPNEALLTYDSYSQYVPTPRGKERVELVVIANLIRPGGKLVRLELGELREIDELVEAWLRAIGGDGDRGRGLAVEASGALSGPAGERLRERILDPVLARLDPSVTHLGICPDQELHRIPFDALPHGSGVLGDRYRVHVESSLARVLHPAPEPEGPVQMLAVGGVDFDSAVGPTTPDTRSVDARLLGEGPLEDDFAPLPGSAIEAGALGSLFEDQFATKATLLVGPDATKQRVLSALPGSRYVHLATHGFFSAFAPTPELDAQEPWWQSPAVATLSRIAPLTTCGLALAGANRGPDAISRLPGILFGEELAAQDLSACELAVLSACETQLGYGRRGIGLSSLQTALHAAGVRTAITSLWRVDDAATLRLMEAFYRALWIDGLSKTDALWHAKGILRAEGAPLRDWAGWVLSGDPR